MLHINHPIVLSPIGNAKIQHRGAFCKFFLKLMGIFPQNREKISDNWENCREKHCNRVEKATQLKSGVSSKQVAPVAGSISIAADKKVCKANDIIALTIKGKDLVSLNALSFALPYNPTDFEFIGIDVKDMGKMENISKDRLHSDGSKILYSKRCSHHGRATLFLKNSLFIL